MTDSATDDTAVKYEKDGDGIVVLTLDDPTSSANTMNELYKESMDEAVTLAFHDRTRDQSADAKSFTAKP